VSTAPANEVIRETGPELVSPAGAVFSPDRVYRYLLTRTWDTRAPLVTWAMLNPSTADCLADDPTIRRCKAFARAWGRGGIQVVNLFGYRATQPAALRTASDPVGPLNDLFIREACQPPGVVVAAWGAHGDFRGRAAEVTRTLAAAGIRMHCLGTTKGGHPRHPLYVPGDTPLEPFEAAR
jgi:hypothetical protein